MDELRRTLIRPLIAATAGLMEASSTGRAWLDAFRCSPGYYPPYEAPGYMLTTSGNWTFFHSHAAPVINSLLKCKWTHGARKYVLMIPYEIGVAHEMLPMDVQRDTCEEPGLNPLGLSEHELAKCGWAVISSEDNSLIWMPGTFHAVWTECDDIRDRAVHNGNFRLASARNLRPSSCSLARIFVVFPPEGHRANRTHGADSEKISPRRDRTVRWH